MLVPKMNIDFAKGNTKRKPCNIYPYWFQTEAFMSLPDKVRLLYFCLLMLSDAEGRLIKTSAFILRNFGYADFSSVEEIEEALMMMADNGLIIIYDYTETGLTVELIQIVDYHKTQAGKAYQYGSSNYPAPVGYEVPPPEKKIKAEMEKDSRFINFYATYPRKYRKASAAVVWSDINPSDEEFHKIMEGLARWIPYWVKVGQDSIPNPDVFLKNRLYLKSPSASSAVPEDQNGNENVSKSCKNVESTHGFEKTETMDHFTSGEGYSEELPF